MTDGIEFEDEYDLDNEYNKKQFNRRLKDWEEYKQKIKNERRT